MANKDDINISSSYDEFGDFDFNIDESGTKRDRVAQPSKIRSDYLPSMKSGFVEGLKRELASKMPYTAAAVDQVSSIYNEAKQMTQQFTAEATPLVRSIGRSTNRLMPLVRPFMPKGVYDKITGKLSQIPDEQGELSEEEKQAQQISADINAAFQGSDANAQVRANMENVIGGMRHKATMGALSGLLGQMQTTNKFLTTSLMAYMKKDLELQYRQLYTQRDIASTLRGTAKVLEAELKNITHNSGLPDMIKAKDFQRRTTKREKLRDYTANFWKNMMGNLKTNVMDQIKSALEGVEMLSSGAADMKDMQEEMEGKPLSLRNLILKGLFKYGGNVVGSKLTGKIAKMGQVALGGFDSIFENFNNNLIRGVENYARKDNLLGSFLSLILPQKPGNDTSIQNVLSKNPTQPVQFDISTREAIVTIIPGYLAKLNKLVEDIKDPKTEHEELVYSTDERRFVSKTALNSTADSIIDKILNPNVYGATDHLAVLTTGRSIHGRSGKQMRNWFENKNKDGGGKSNRELVERFFQNLVRSEDHLLDVAALDAYVNNRDMDRGMPEYVSMATEGLGDAAPRIVDYILGSLKKTNGEWNQTAIRKYQKILDNTNPYYEVNDVSQKFSTAMNDMSEEKRERIFAVLEDMGLYNRKEGSLNLNAMNEYTAAKRSKIDIGDAVNSWTSQKAREDIIREQAFTVNGVMARGLDSFNGFLTNVKKDIEEIGSRTKGQLKDMASKGSVRMAALSGNFVRSVFGDEMAEAFKLMSDSLIDRYKRANGVATVALDLALVSGEFDDADLQIVRDFAEQSMQEKDSEKITQMRLGAIGSIENEDLRNIFAEATSGITSRKDAINHFGTMKQRINMLQEEEVYKAAHDTLKAKLSKVKEKGTSVKGKLKSGVDKIKSWFTFDDSDKSEAKQSEETKKEGIVSAIAETVKEKSKAAGESISKAVDNIRETHAGVNEVLVKGLDEYKTYISTMDENVARIYSLLEKKLGNLSEEELTELHTKAQKLKEEMEAKQSEETKKKKSQFGKKLKGFLGGAVGMLNPFKSLNAAKIAAKYQITSTPESAFHADFQAYFAYRKEMDVCMSSYLSRKGLIAQTVGGTLRGIGNVIGGTAKGLGAAAKGMYTAGGKVIGGALPALGYLGGGLIHGGAVVGKGIMDLGLAVGNRTWDMFKGGMKLGKWALFGSGKSKDTEQWYDLYCKDEVGEPGWEKNPILSVRTQKKGIYNIGPDGKATGLCKKTDDIVGPVMNKKGKLLITKEQWDAGIVSVEGKSISQKAKEHASGSLIQIGGGHSLLGGLFSGLGSLLGGGLKGGGTVLAKMLGINWDVTKMIGSGLKNAWTGIKGIGSNLAGALGIGTSEKAQRKKYSVIIGEFEKVNKTLATIRDEGLPTKKKKVKGDKDGDGDRDNSYTDMLQQEKEKNQDKGKFSFFNKLLGVIGREKKDGKIVKKETPWWKKLYTFFTNPNGKFMLSLSASALVMGALLKKYGPQKVIEIVTNASIAAATAINWIYDICKKIYEFFAGEPHKDPEIIGPAAEITKGYFTGTTTASMIYHSEGATRARNYKEIMRNRTAYQEAAKRERDARTAAREAIRKAEEAEKLKKAEKLRKAEAARRAKRAHELKKLREAARKSPTPKGTPKGSPKGSPKGTPKGSPKGAPKGTPKNNPLPPKGSPTTSLKDLAKRRWDPNLKKWVPGTPSGTPTVPKTSPNTKVGRLCQKVHDWLGKMWTKIWRGIDKAKDLGGKLASWADDFVKWFSTIKSESVLGWIFGIIAKVFKCNPETIAKIITAADRVSIAACKSGKAIYSASKFLISLLPGVGFVVKAVGFIFKWILGGLCAVFGWITKILVKSDPKIVAIIGEFVQYLFDGWAIYCAYESGDDNFMQDYWEAQFILFGSRCVGIGLKIADIASFMAAFGGNPFAVIYKAGTEIFRPVVNMAISADIATRNAQKSYETVIEGEHRLQSMYGAKITDNEARDFVSDMHRWNDQHKPKVDDQTGWGQMSTGEKMKRWIPVYGQYKLLQDAGEAVTDLRLHDQRVRARREETKSQISDIVSQICNNKYLPPSLQKDLMQLLRICVTEQGYADRHPWGFAVYSTIRDFCVNDPKILKDRYQRASDFVNGRARCSSTKDEAYQYVWAKCNMTLVELFKFIDSIVRVDEAKAEAERRAAEARAAQEAQLKRQQEEAARKTKIRLVDDSIEVADNEVIKHIDSIFNDSKDTGIGVDRAFENANVIFADYLKDHDQKWPKSGIYEYGNAIFVIFWTYIKLKKYTEFDVKTASFKYIEGLVKDKYKAEVSVSYFGEHEDVEADMKGQVIWSCKHNGSEKLVDHKELHCKLVNDSKPHPTFFYAVAVRKTQIVPDKIRTRADVGQTRVTPPQGQTKKVDVPEGTPKPNIVEPKPLPESLKPKSTDRFVVMGNVLLPYEGESQDAYNARLEAAKEKWQREYGEPVYSYFTKNGKAAAVKAFLRSKELGIETFAKEAKKDGVSELYALKANPEPPKLPQKKEDPKPKPVEKISPAPKPESVQHKPVLRSDTNAGANDWRAAFERQQNELDTLRAMLRGESTTANYLRQLVDLNTKGNALAEANGKAQQDQFDVFGRRLVETTNRQPQVVVVSPDSTKTIQPPVKVNSPLKLAQGAAQ